MALSVVGGIKIHNIMCKKMELEQNRLKLQPRSSLTSKGLFLLRVWKEYQKMDDKKFGRMNRRIQRTDRHKCTRKCIGKGMNKANRAVTGTYSRCEFENNGLYRDSHKEVI